MRRTASSSLRLAATTLEYAHDDVVRLYDGKLDVRLFREKPVGFEEYPDSRNDEGAEIFGCRVGEQLVRQ